MACCGGSEVSGRSSGYCQPSIASIELCQFRNLVSFIDCPSVIRLIVPLPPVVITRAPDPRQRSITSLLG
jgi:hypothetical protein